MARNQFVTLIVDDEVRILHFLRSKLRAAGYEVLTASDGVEALELIHDHDPDLIVLDLVMPRMSGLELLKELRTFSSTPVIILSARGSDQDKIQGLKLGADDYLPKPFNPEELVARIEAVKRRMEPREKVKPVESLTVGHVTIDFKNRRVVARGEEVHLTKIEWLLLTELARNAGRLMPYEELLTRVWGPAYQSDIQLLRPWISRLRQKLQDDLTTTPLIATIPKTGYIMNQPSNQPTA